MRLRDTINNDIHKTPLISKLNFLNDIKARNGPIRRRLHPFDIRSTSETTEWHELTAEYTTEAKSRRDLISLLRKNPGNDDTGVVEKLSKTNRVLRASVLNNENTTNNKHYELVSGDSGQVPQVLWR
ncbi:uncharacterized protein LOC130671269 isoform X2 [Microplitis mediator]|uniref:uncharacterized protein LOC130671269 isoform X2 n=1 Tax=Microplitis mediator TaxID=375433 RepID=UPI002553251B|nr:uncharacterized protein LOC130671269 isoform X2 [Microplitis mediator]